jgi:hypothetical protein
MDLSDFSDPVSASLEGTSNNCSYPNINPTMLYSTTLSKTLKQAWRQNNRFAIAFTCVEVRTVWLLV